jgi:hypothetical protein
MLARKLCLERALPRCRERPGQAFSAVARAIGNGEFDEPRPQNASRAMNAVTTALACGQIAPGEAATSAGVGDVRATRRHCQREGRAWRSVADLEGRRRRRRRRTRTSAMPKPATITTRGRRRPTGAAETIRRRILIQPKGKILLQIFCRCRKRNRALQFVVDLSLPLRFALGIAKFRDGVPQPGDDKSTS